MKKNTFFEKIAAPEPIHLMTEVTSILDSICKGRRKTAAFYSLCLSTEKKDQLF